MIRTVLIFALLMMAFAYLAPQFLQVLDRPATEAPAARAPAATARVQEAEPDTSSSGGKYRVAADRSGHFIVDARIEGRNLEAVIDTGATAVALRYEDARLLGLIKPTDAFDHRVSTANGVARARAVRLSSVRVGSITVSNVDALVTEPGALGINLLGMSFLRRLTRFEVSGGVLVLQR